MCAISASIVDLKFFIFFHEKKDSFFKKYLKNHFNDLKKKRFFFSKLSFKCTSFHSFCSFLFSIIFLLCLYSFYLIFIPLPFSFFWPSKKCFFLLLFLISPFFLLCFSLLSESAVKSLSRVRVFATPWTVAYKAPLSMGFSRQEYWSGLPFPSPGDLPNPGIEPGSPSLQADALPSEPPGKPFRQILK